MAIDIRPGRPTDAGAIVEMIDALNSHVGAPQGAMTREVLLDHAFRDPPLFEIAVAEETGVLLGYAAWCEAYETKHAMAGLYMIDLYVRLEARRRGVARRLVARLSAIARKRGRGFLWWTALPENGAALAFYRSLGARAEPTLAHALSGEAFDRLAADDA